MRLGILRRRQTTVLLLSVTIVFSGCMRSPEAKSARYMELGKGLMKKNDPPRAILQFRNAIQATPRNPEAHYQISLAYLASGDLRHGVASLRKTLELNPKHRGAQFQLAQLLASSNLPKDLRDAQARLQELLRSSPDDADALHTLALTELELGQPDDAMQHLQQAIATAPQDEAIAATMAEAKLRQHDARGAEDVLKKASENAPQSSDLVVILGRLYALQNRKAEAEQQFKKALSIHANDEAALLNLATLQMTLGRNQDAEANFRLLGSVSKKSLKHVHASFLFQTGRRDEAIREFEKLSKQEPEDRLARTRWIAALVVANRLPEAGKILNAVLNKAPNDLDALLQRGELSLQLGDNTKAEADLNKVLHMRADAAEVHYALAKLHRARGATLLQRQELDEVLRRNRFLLVARLELAESLTGQKLGQAALVVLDAAPEAQKNTASLIEQRNWALISTGQAAETRKGVDRGLAVARTPVLLIQDGILRISERRFAEARVSLHEALLKAPQDVRVLRLLVTSYVAQKQLPAAVREVRDHAEKHPNSPDVQYFLGTLMVETGDLVHARKAFAAARAANPNYAPADLALARIELTQANWNNARQELSTILSSKKEENPQARLWMGMLEESVGNHPAALAAFLRVLEIEPNNALALNNVAYLLAETGGRGDEALKYAQKALELSPDNPDFRDTLGWVLYKKGIYDAAVTQLKSAVSKGGGVRQQYHLAMAYLKAGQEDRGRATLQAALRQDSSLPEAKQAQEAFRTGSTETRSQR